MSWPFVRFIKLPLSLLLFVAFLFTGKAAHLVGGEMTYRCLGNNNYEVTLIIYRDCLSTGALFDSHAVMSVYDQYNMLVANDSVPLLRVNGLPLIAPNNCTSLPQSVCTERALYVHTFSLPPASGGYTITHQRCCRNNTITNINNNSSQWGSTFTTSIPHFDFTCNSSPKFRGDPPVVLCQNVPVKLNLGANDLNGDSLHYELCTPLNGGSNTGGQIAPNPATPPPYQAVPFLPGYGVQNPISSFPAFYIDSQTGILSGTPNQIGQFVFAICVTEYRNGIPLSTTRRDFQFNVTNSCRSIIARIEDQAANPQNLCSGGKIRFKNISQYAKTYLWDFGDPTTNADTSRLANPTYFYKDTGTYEVRLIADPNSSCADTTYALFKVYDSTRVEYVYQGEQCFTKNHIDFMAFGNFTPNARFFWSFGGTTSIGTNSTQQSPQGVTWTKPGTYYVSVTVVEFNCDYTYGDSIDIFTRPEIGEIVPSGTGCLPHKVNFTDQTVAMGPVEHWWSFGDGNYSKAPNPSHVYTTPGLYTVEHSIKSLRGCIDSGYTKYQNVIEVYPVPFSDLSWLAKEKSIYDPEFQVSNASTGHTSTFTILPNGQEIENLSENVFTLSDTGNFEVIHISYNQYGCSDTLFDTIRVDDPFTLYIPSAFSPNGDGINDKFTFKMSGISKMYMEIYNRWGEIVYSSSNPYDGWNGNHYNSGKALPSGVYTYVFIGTVKDGAKEHVSKGHVTLLR